MNTPLRIPCTPDMFTLFLQSMAQGITPQQLIESEGEKRTLCSLSAFYVYVNASSKSGEQYTRAREKMADAMADATTQIADTDMNPQRANNRIKARQWLASKIKPKVYGDKLDLDVNHRIDVHSAILAARRRAQAIDITPQYPQLTTDIQSVDSEPVDPFS